MGTAVGTTMGIVVVLLMMVAVGGIVGLLARALMPGPNPMSAGMTILLGIGGSFVGGLLGRLLHVSGVGGIVLGVLGALLLLWVVPKLRKAR